MRLFAVDIDGTLVDKDLQVSPHTLEAITYAKEQGVQLVIATGRSYQSALPYARALGLDGAPLIAYNGGLVREYPSGDTLFHLPVPLGPAKRLAAYCEAQGYHLQAYVHDELYVPEGSPWTQTYTSLTQIPAHPVSSLSSWLAEAPTKMLIINRPECISEIQSHVCALVGDQLKVSPSDPRFLEIVHPAVSKGAALQAVAERLGIAREQVAAVGDGMNDLTMLSWVGTGFAIAHAPDELKRVAARVVGGPGQGIGEALQHVGLVQ